MRLFEMHGADALNALCDLVEPASRIVDDQETLEAFRKLALLDAKKIHPWAMWASMGMILRPVIKAHSEDLMQIAAALTGKPLDEVSKQPLMQTVQEVRAVWDKDIRDFFISSAPTAPEE